MHSSLEVLGYSFAAGYGEGQWAGSTDKRGKFPGGVAMVMKMGGMALLEVLVAMTVLALGLMAAAALQVRGTQAFDRAQREGQALHLAQGLLERVRGAGRLTDSDEAAWRAQVIAALGASAQGHVSVVGDAMKVEVQWSGSDASLNVQGRVLP
ncbi:type IV pilus modification PilV family protein [Pseudomonas sp. NY15463]|uniref:type IV pilus modification PilV family protein n=1 Tax=Pseudomonas sp. NY15463 TaxID=3400361 RepID=UPI003A88F85E